MSKTVNMGKTIYERMNEAGLVAGSHESDLYVKDTPEARAILKEVEVIRGVRLAYSAFVSNINNERCLDIPFMYDPWWEARGMKVKEEVEVGADEAGRNKKPALSPGN